ncbi:MAG TPA: TetR/AcrR family transcriptional regulator [Terriglobales bacterium]|nr:TetR/AcrR family transcriptional regulator [Terriglobales bacterium]
MSTSHARVPAVDRRHQILTVATELFARQGYQGTTTRQIAEQAGVNEAIIFRHFPTKEELYWAIIELQTQEQGLREKLLARLSRKGSDYEVFRDIARVVLDRDTTLTRLLLFSALENHELSYRFFRSHAMGCYELLADFIRQGIREGRFREVDPWLAARGFFGMIFYHFLVQGLYGGEEIEHFDPGLVCSTLVNIWLGGMRPEGGALGNGHLTRREKAAREKAKK